jgi:hypothetical protein
MDQLTLPVPDGCPLYARQHIVKAEMGVKMTDRVLEDRGWVYRQEIFVDLLGELQIT